MKILIIEDEIELLIAINNFLTKENYVCELAENLRKGFEKLTIYEYDIILLDITLPDGNGLTLLNTIKKYQKKAGVIIISAKNSIDDKIYGLDLGADDYLTKPFHPSELNSRIKAVLRRKQFDGYNIITFDEISINTESKSVSVKGQEIILTKKEYDLIILICLIV
jgi:DNA-binding response OmpR family regulator